MPEVRRGLRRDVLHAEDAGGRPANLAVACTQLCVYHHGVDGRQLVREHINNAGGVIAIAEASGVHKTRIYAWLAGGDMEEANRGKLRSALPSVSSETWADVFAPKGVK